MKYLSGYITAAVFGALSWVLMEFGERFTVVVDMVYPYVIRTLQSFLAEAIKKFYHAKKKKARKFAGIFGVNPEKLPASPQFFNVKSRCELKLDRSRRNWGINFPGLGFLPVFGQNIRRTSPAVFGDFLRHFLHKTTEKIK